MYDNFDKTIWIYRVIVRTSNVNVLRGSVLEELIPPSKYSNSVSQELLNIYFPLNSSHHVYSVNL